MEYIELNNGIKMPKAGFGVYQIGKDECEECVLNAIKVGYRLIDTAQSYFNEEEVGNAIEKEINEGLVKREELFITTKVWIDNYGYEKCKESVLESMNKLSDICLFEREIIPQVNQVETNVFNAQFEAQKNMKKHNVQIEAWAPFAEGRNNMFSNEVLAGIGKKYNKSVAQVILRWLVQRNVVALSKTTDIEKMKENINIFDFELSSEDMQEIAKLDTQTSSFFSHYNPNMVAWFDQTVVSRRTNHDHSRDKKNW